MNDQMNGIKTLPPSMSMSGQVVTPEAAINMLERALGPTFTIMLKGTQASFSGFPPQLVMLAACKVLGHLVGGTFAGANAPLAPLMKARADCKELFDKSIKEVPITAMGGSSKMPIPNPPQG
jgi:hypothetical protein